MKRAVLTALALAAACSAQRQPTPSHGVPTPLSSDSNAALSRTKSAAKPAGRVSIEEFVPLSSLPELAAANRALESGNARLAAREVAGVLAKSPPAAEDVPRFQYLLARLRERAGDLRGATASYELAAREKWPLSPYAAVGVGRTMLRAGRSDEALRRLRAVPLDGPLAEEARLLMAEAALATKQHDVAIEAWRAHLAASKSPADAVNVSLRLAEALLARAERHSAVDGVDADLVDALRLARRVAAEQAGNLAMVRRAEALEKRALGAMPKAHRGAHERPTPEDELVRVQALYDAREYESAERAADALLAGLPAKERWQNAGCEAAVLRGKAVSAQRSTGRAVDAMKEPLVHCKSDPDVRARVLYLAGRYAARDGRHAQAIAHWADLEKELPQHRLADDARMLAAFSYFELGVEARFTELLGKMPEDYPDGDMVLDGVFRLAMRRIEKGDWSGAASVLDRAARLVTERDSARGTEFSGRERYFRARAWIETGDVDRGQQELAAIVKELPLSYYMLHAYSRLVDKDPFAARKLREEAAAQSAKDPFSFEHQPEFDSPGFKRALELLRQGDLESAKREVDALQIAKPGAAPQLLWGLALLYSKAGAAKDSHGVARGLLTDWLGRWPAGDWMRAWELAFPRPHHGLVQREAKKNGVPESLIYGVMREESAFDPDAVSHADAHGLMQLIPPTAKMLAKPIGLPHDVNSLKRPAINIALGARGLSQLNDSFRTNPVLAIPGYNAGPGRPRRWLRERPHMDFDVWVELIPYNETRRYTKRVLASRAAYAYLYEPATADEAMVLPLRLTP